jgi:hypothetical protein
MKRKGNVVDVAQVVAIAEPWREAVAPAVVDDPLSKPHGAAAPRTVTIEVSASKRSVYFGGSHLVDGLGYLSDLRAIIATSVRSRRLSKKEPLLTKAEAVFIDSSAGGLIDDLDDLARSGINQYSVVIHVGISIALDVIFVWNIVVSHPVLRQDRANSEIAIVVRGVMLTRDVLMEPGTGIHSENAAKGSCHRAHGAPDDRHLRGPSLCCLQPRLLRHL